MEKVKSEKWKVESEKWKVKRLGFPLFTFHFPLSLGLISFIISDYVTGHSVCVSDAQKESCFEPGCIINTGIGNRREHRHFQHGELRSATVLAVSKRRKIVRRS